MRRLGKNFRAFLEHRRWFRKKFSCVGVNLDLVDWWTTVSGVHLYVSGNGVAEQGIEEERLWWSSDLTCTHRKVIVLSCRIKIDWTELNEFVRKGPVMTFWSAFFLRRTASIKCWLNERTLFNVCIWEWAWPDRKANTLDRVGVRERESRNVNIVNKQISIQTLIFSKKSAL